MQQTDNVRLPFTKITSLTALCAFTPSTSRSLPVGGSDLHPRLCVGLSWSEAFHLLEASPSAMGCAGSSVSYKPSRFVGLSATCLSSPNTNKKTQQQKAPAFSPTPHRKGPAYQSCHVSAQTHRGHVRHVMPRAVATFPLRVDVPLTPDLLLGRRQE